MSRLNTDKKFRDVQRLVAMRILEKETMFATYKLLWMECPRREVEN